MDFIDCDIREVLPQRPPMLMVDRISSFEMDDVFTRLAVREDCIFVEDGVLLTAGIVENMAQSSAARIGYINKFILHKPVEIGFIGAVRNLKVFRNPHSGEELVTEIVKIEEVFGITMVRATVSVGDEIVAEATLKTALAGQHVSQQ